MTHIFCVKGQERTGFGLVLKKFVGLLSSGTASANGEQLLLILERQALRALSAFHFEEVKKPLSSLWSILDTLRAAFTGIWVIVYDSSVELF